MKLNFRNQQTASINTSSPNQLVEISADFTAGSAALAEFLGKVYVVHVPGQKDSAARLAGELQRSAS